MLEGTRSLWSLVIKVIKKSKILNDTYDADTPDTNIFYFWPVPFPGLKEKASMKIRQE